MRIPFSRACLAASSCLAFVGCSDQGIISENRNCVADHTVVLIPEGEYRLGDERFYEDEGPIRRVSIAEFDIDQTEVTNAQFAAFVRETGYVTRAERGLQEDRFSKLPEKIRRPGSAVFVKPGSAEAGNPVDWWRFVEGASWRHPHGPDSTIEGMELYPVVHVAYEDAVAYAQWAGRRLPTEDEWEAAARGGLESVTYAWGDEPPDTAQDARANTWQGIFPYINQKKDGYEGISPVGCFAPNNFDVYDMTGNVWEWTSDRYSQDRRMHEEKAGGREDFDAIDAAGVIKGGSFLCADNYCYRYRPAARQPQELLLGASHIGFRTVSKAPQ